MAKRICTLGLCTALCLVLGYLERMVSLSFIAPGIHLGLANTAALLLIVQGDKSGALLVNITRIALTALLFGSPVSFAFSLAGGLGAWVLMVLLSKCKTVSVLGMSIAGGAIHNALQLIVAIILIGTSIIYYLPLLLLSGAVSGALIGFLCTLVQKYLKFQ